ncbi:unnamed protein product [Nyctereutes procyonoides]|uniref:(raccoon dog) hypothetical protein n=1 Tax=Nyctereutes procyonoides TaxID=34880 RepID=A0A811Z7A3_NYCPR|nr:unnamed protein product [Nyctereutes procyonoides]
MGAIVGVHICHNQDQEEPNTQIICFWPDEPTTFNQVVLKRLFMNHTNLPPLSLSQVIWKMKLPGQENQTAVVVGSMTDDVCIQEVPKLKVCVLHTSSLAWSCILRAGSKILTFDELVLHSPKGCCISLSSGPHTGQEVYQHFCKGRIWGVPEAHRASRGYKNKLTFNLKLKSTLQILC